MVWCREHPLATLNMAEVFSLLTIVLGVMAWSIPAATILFGVFGVVLCERASADITAGLRAQTQAEQGLPGERAA